MKPSPPGWPRISSGVWYEDPAKAIDWLWPKKDAAPRDSFRKSPQAVGGANTQNMMIYVDDVDAHCQRAREAGARIVEEPKTTDHGEDYWADRGYLAEDIEGHHWWFFQRLRDPVVK